MNLLELQKQRDEILKIKEVADVQLNKLTLLEKEIKQTDKEISLVANSIDKSLKDSIEKDKFIEFFKKPYAIVPQTKNKVLVIVPKFIKGFQVGWLLRDEGNFFVYQLDQYSSWLGDIPQELLNEINLKKEFEAQIVENSVLFDPSEKEAVKKGVGRHLTDFTANSARIVKGHEFDLIADMIERGNLPFKPKPVNAIDLRLPKSKLELRNYQQPAFDKFLATGAIGLFHPTGAGKSMIALKCIDVVKGPKLIVVPTRTLVEQWNWYIDKYVPHCKSEITIMTYQGFRNRNESYALVVYDECLVAGSQIIKKDGGITNIEDIQNGDKVVGGLVKNKFTRKTNTIYKISTSFGDIITTVTHPHITLKKIRNKHLNQFEANSVKNISVKLAKDLVPLKDYMLVPEKIPHTEKFKIDRAELEFAALIMCDGHIEKRTNTLKVCVSKSGEKEWVREVFIKGINSLGCSKFWEFNNKRGDYTIGCCSKFVKDCLVKRYKISPGKKSHSVDIVDKIFYASLDSIKGFIDIAFSSEGSIDKSGLQISMRSKNFIKKLQFLLKKFGIHSSFCVHKKQGYREQYQLNVGSKDFNLFFKEIGLTHKIKSNKFIQSKEKFMNDKIRYQNQDFRVVKILRIAKEKKDCEVYDFESTSHTFLANGILTHNCQKLPADTFSRLALINTKYRIGLSASPHREDGRERYIFALTGFPVGLNWKDYMETVGKSYHPIYVHTVKGEASKLSKAIELMNPKKKTLIFCDSIELGKKLANMINVPFIYGETENRMDLIEKNKVLVVSRVMDLGVSIKDLNHIIEIDFLFGSRQQEIQRTGRLMHSEETDVRHDIIFTEKELESYGKRLFALQEKGFTIKVVN